MFYVSVSGYFEDSAAGSVFFQPGHAFPAALPAEMLDVLTEEERWVAEC